ncbi:hypothetical protein, partial [Maribellus sp. YY47]|uniref:hypothetical protein n=1 Tax=Maribellus sp. YY47 TaxID=2929486 RepID=UPI00200067A5
MRADFGIDGDVWADILSFYPTPPPINPIGTDDWFSALPDGNTATGAGVIDITSAAAVAEIAKISGGQNVGIELRMSAPVYTAPDGNGTWVDAAYLRDQNIAGGNQDMTVFDQSINKNFDDPRSWGFKEGDVPAKTDIIDVYGHIRRLPLAPPADDEYAIFGASTADADGSNHLDFEYFRKRVDFVDNHIVYEDENDGGDCGHTAYSFFPDGSVEIHGDVILSVDYVNGGVNANISMYAWIDKRDFPTDADLDAFNLLPGRPFEFVIANDAFYACTNSFDDDPDDDNFGYQLIQLRSDLQDEAVHTQLNDAGQVAAPPWGTINSKGNVVTQYPTNTLVEFAINATALGFDTRSGADPCISTLGSVIVKSRSSASLPSSLKDMGGPFDLGDKPQLEVFLEGGAACEGDPPVVLTADLGNSPAENPPSVDYEYTWYKEGPADVWTVVGTDSPTYPVPTNVVGDFSFKVSVKAINGGIEGCIKTSEPAMVTIHATPDLMVKDLEACEVGNTGEASFNLYDAVTSDGGGVLSYHMTQQNAIDSASAIDPSVVVAVGSSEYWIRSSNPGDGDLDCFDYEMVTITVYDNPVADLDADDECEDGQGNAIVDFDASGSTAGTNGMPIATYGWDWDNNGSIDETTVSAMASHSFAVGTHTVGVTVTDEFGCYNSTTTQFTVYDNPVADLDADDECEDGLGNAVVDFDASGSTAGTNGMPIATYGWDWDNNGSIDETTVSAMASHSFAVGTHTVGVTVTDEFGCYNSTTTQFTVYDNPVADLDADDECEDGLGNAVVDFDASGSTAGTNGMPIATYGWDWDNNGSIDETTASAMASHSFAVGTHTVGVTVTDEFGCYNSTTTQFTVYDNPLADLDADDECEDGLGNAVVDFDASGSTAGTNGMPIATYGWDWDNNGSIDETTVSAMASHSFAVGTHTVGVTVTDEFGCYNSTTTQFTVYDNPVADLDADDECEDGLGNAVVDFDASGSTAGTNGMPIATYGWDWDNNGSIDETTASAMASHSFAVGTHTVGVTVTDEFGCYNSTTTQFTVYDNPVADLDADDECEDGLGNAVVDFDASGSTAGTNGMPIATYGWDWDNNGSIDETTVSAMASHSFAVGTHTVGVTVTDEFGCYNSTTTQFTIYDNPVADLDADDECEDGLGNAVVDFDASGSTAGTNGTPIATYGWDWDNNGSIDETTVSAMASHSFAVGTHTVGVTVTDEFGCYNSTTTQFTVYDNPVADLDADDECEDGLGNAVVDFDASGSTAGTNGMPIATYGWDWDNNGSIDETTVSAMASHSFAVGTHTVGVTVTDEFGCYNSTTTQFTVYDNPVADLDADDECEDGLGNAVVDFDASGSTAGTNGMPIATYGWDWDNNGSIDETTVSAMASHSFAVGTHTVGVTVTDEFGCYNSTTTQFTVYDNPVADLDADDECEDGLGNAVVDFDASGSTAGTNGMPIATYGWDWDNNGSIDETTVSAM